MRTNSREKPNNKPQTIYYRRMIPRKWLQTCEQTRTRTIQREREKTKRVSHIGTDRIDEVILMMINIDGINEWLCHFVCYVQHGNIRNRHKHTHAQTRRNKEITAACRNNGRPSMGNWKIGILLKSSAIKHHRCVWLIEQNIVYRPAEQMNYFFFEMKGTEILTRHCIYMSFPTTSCLKYSIFPVI